MPAGLNILAFPSISAASKVNLLMFLPVNPGSALSADPLFKRLGLSKIIAASNNYLRNYCWPLLRDLIPGSCVYKVDSTLYSHSFCRLYARIFRMYGLPIWSNPGIYARAGLISRDYARVMGLARPPPLACRPNTWCCLRLPCNFTSYSHPFAQFSRAQIPVPSRARAYARIYIVKLF